MPDKDGARTTALAESTQLFEQLWEISRTICEGVAYLAGHPEDGRVVAAVQSGMETVASYVGPIPELPDLNGTASGEAFQGRRGSVGQYLAGRIAEKWEEAWKDTPYIDRPTALAAFQFYDAAPHVLQTYQLLFTACEKSALSAPLESFQYTMRLFEEQPGLLSGKDSYHPGYVYRPSEQVTFEKCPICGGEGKPFYRVLAYRMSDFSYPDLPVKLWLRCDRCEDLYTWKFPVGYLTSCGQPGVRYPRAEKYLTAMQPTSGGSLAVWSDILAKLHGYTKGNTLLEVGIGHGELLAVALEMGYDVSAVEINENCAQDVADTLAIPIWAGDFLNYEAGRKFHVITMGDVIEHVTCPKDALRKVYEILEDDGVLWLSTPNYESSFSRMLKYKDPMWMEPHHVSYFSRRGLEALARECGFTVREYNVSKRYNGSMELVLTKHAVP